MRTISIKFLNPDGSTDEQRVLSCDAQGILDENKHTGKKVISFEPVDATKGNSTNQVETARLNEIRKIERIARQSDSRADDRAAIICAILGLFIPLLLIPAFVLGNRAAKQSDGDYGYGSLTIAVIGFTIWAFGFAIYIF